MPPTLPLTPREYAVLAGIARGIEGQQIAVRLHISHTAVENCIIRMRKRYGLRNRAALVDHAYRQGWLAGLRREYRPHIQLTDRLLDVLEGAAAGETDVEISARLGISPLTVKRHFERLSEILDARRRWHAVAVAWQLGLLEHRRRGREPIARHG